MTDRQHRLVLVPLEQHRIEFRQRRQPQKAAVDPPFVDPALHLAVIAEQHFTFDAGVVSLQSGKQLRQPVYGDARKGADAHNAALDPFHAADLPLKLGIPAQQPAQIRQKLLPRRGQADAVFAPLEQRHAPFALEIRHHLADGGLGIVERLCRFGKAALFHGFDKSPVFVERCLHGYPFHSSIDFIYIIRFFYFVTSCIL